MRIEVKGRQFEFTVDGKPLDENEGDDVFEGLLALASVYFPFAVMTRDKDSVRALTLAVDDDYVDQLVACMEPKLPEGEAIGVLILAEDEDEDIDE